MFGKRIADERQRLGLTQKQLAEKLGVGRSAVAMIETDRAPIDIGRLMDLEQHGFDPFYVMYGESGAAIAGQHLNWDLFTEILSAVRAWSEGRKLVLSTEKEIVICKLLYGHFVARGFVDPQVLQDTIRLAA